MKASLRILIIVGVFIPYLTISQNQWTPFANSVSTKGYEGCQFKFSASVSTELNDTNARVQLWVRVNLNEAGIGFFNNMADMPIRNAQWQTYTIEGIIDSNSRQISFGLMTFYSGIFFFDNFELVIKNKEGIWETKYKNDFEDGQIRLNQGTGGGKDIMPLYKAAVVEQNNNKFLRINGTDAIEHFQNELLKRKEDTTKVQVFFRLAGLYLEKNNREKAIQFNEEALKLSQAIGYNSGEIQYYYSMANIYRNDIPYNSQNVADYYKKGLEFSEKKGLNNDIIEFLSSLDNLYNNESNWTEALNYAYKLLKIAESTNNKEMLANSNNSVGACLDELKNHKEALIYYQASLKFVEELKDDDFKALLYINIGDIYLDMSDYNLAFDYMSKAIEISKNQGSKVLAMGYLFLGHLFIKMGDDFETKKDNTTAANKFKEALNAYTNAQKYYHDVRLLNISKSIDMHIGVAHYKLKNFAKADSLLELSLSVSGNFEFAKERRRDAYLYLSKIDSINGNWEGSHIHYLKYISYRDELFNEENTKKTTMYQMQYDFDKKEAAAKAEQEKKELAIQKEIELKALNYEYEKKQAAAKSEKEKQQLKYEQQLKQQQIEAEYAQKTAAIEAEQKRKEAIAQLEQEKKDALNASALALSQAEVKRKNQERNYFMIGFGLLAALLSFIVYGYFQKQKANTLLQQQKAEIDQKSHELEKSFKELKATQTQLIQSEKLASLGELTAGIAHEIQNPLNFVNNFSELSVDLAKDINDEIHKSDIDKEYVEELLTDLTSNQEKINHHGKRASSIVKGMLEHSRASTGVKELTDINKLADEYLRLSYHGLRAKDNSFNADFKTEFDPTLPKIEVIPQDMGRVLLNLINNAFYAVNQRKLLSNDESYAPSVSVSTNQLENAIEIRVKDNGIGMPESIRAKVFQPFFTTKPTGQGTGLGLSLAYDIVTKGHGGTLEVTSTVQGDSPKESFVTFGEGVGLPVRQAGSEFIITLPFKTNLKYLL